ncbi:MAG: hypothetical protein ACO37W_02015 [Prochlorotrichaceae cyanobacterium]
MKLSLSALSLGIAATLVAFPIDPLISQYMTHTDGADGTIALAQEQQSLDLTLTGHKREVRTNRQGLPEVVWLSLEGGLLKPPPRLQPGDVVRYTISGNNRTEQPIRGLVLNDDIPENMVIVLGTARVENGTASITYSADGGQSYSPSPMIRERRSDGTLVSRPAKPEEYTHVRWTFTEPIPAKSSVGGSYQVRLQ